MCNVRWHIPVRIPFVNIKQTAISRVCMCVCVRTRVAYSTTKSFISFSSSTRTIRIALHSVQQSLHSQTHTLAHTNCLNGKWHLEHILMHKHSRQSVKMFFFLFFSSSFSKAQTVMGPRYVDGTRMQTPLNRWRSRRRRRRRRRESLTLRCFTFYSLSTLHDCNHRPGDGDGIIFVLRLGVSVSSSPLSSSTLSCSHLKQYTHRYKHRPTQKPQQQRCGKTRNHKFSSSIFSPNHTSAKLNENKINSPIRTWTTESINGYFCTNNHERWWHTRTHSHNCNRNPIEFKCELWWLTWSTAKCFETKRYKQKQPNEILIRLRLRAIDDGAAKLRRTRQIK